VQYLRPTGQRYEKSDYFYCFGKKSTEKFA